MQIQIINDIQMINDLKDDVLYVSEHQEIIDYLNCKGVAVAGYRNKDKEDIWLKNVKYIVEDVEELTQDEQLKIYQRVKEMPWTILETTHLLVRETTVEDIDYFYTIYENPLMTKYTDRLFTNPEDEKEYQKRYIQEVYEFMGYGIWTVTLKETGEIIGRAGLAVREGYEIPELGFLIGVPWQNRGYAYEVCTAIIEYAKKELEFEGIMAVVHSDNEKSNRLCKKLGFQCTEEVIEPNMIVWKYSFEAC